MEPTEEGYELYVERLKALKVAEGRLDAVGKIRAEFEAIRSRGERLTWDLWEGVVKQIEADLTVAALATVDVALEVHLAGKKSVH